MKLVFVRSSIAIALVFAVIAGFSAAASAQKFNGVTLTVGTFGGSWKDRLCKFICPKFEAEGGKIEFVTGNPRILLSKVVQARGQAAPMDVMESVDSIWPETKAAGLVAKLNLGNIPNTSQLNKKMYDDFRVANWITQEGFIFHIEKFKEMGIPRPTKFEDLFNPKLKGRVSFPDINVNTAINPIVGFAAGAGGDENNIDPGLKKIKELDVHSFWNSGTQITQMFKAGDIWVAIAHAGWGVRLNDAGVPVGMVHPVVKDKVGMASRGFATVVKGSKNQAAAEWYINQLVSEGMQEILHTKNGIVPTNEKIQEKYAGSPKTDPSGEPFLMLSPKQIANLYYMDYSNFKMQEWTKKWNRMVAR
jgi:putative spermidine/putrescine transport system substrate-binding protein